MICPAKNSPGINCLAVNYPREIFSEKYLVIKEKANFFKLLSLVKLIRQFYGLQQMTKFLTFWEIEKKLK